MGLMFEASELIFKRSSLLLLNNYLDFAILILKNLCMIYYKPLGLLNL